MAVTEAELAAAPTSIRPALPASTSEPRRLRKCYACQSTEHLVRDCTDAAKLAAWGQNAPPRLARNREQVAALFWALYNQEDPSYILFELAAIGPELCNSEESPAPDEEG
ncbi:hypothetical protein CYMTET_41475 [Cymbomonas tetramitiformis]|uniref:CCHC-type domain-containing protein n=1 Tax=Cymbomonas tetramitiformis TaxID=36881 RepID=A0AAE0C727_9CHLO|nr:hypothetical protein CYMTET_41475 [Cymbomonas tetramitiformis]